LRSRWHQNWKHLKRLLIINGQPKTAKTRSRQLDYEKADGGRAEKSLQERMPGKIPVNTRQLAQAQQHAKDRLQFERLGFANPLKVNLL